MTDEVRLSRNAEHTVRRRNRADQTRSIRRLEQIAAEPRGPASTPLTNAGGLRSARVGAWRIIFTSNDDAQVIGVDDMGPRG